MKWLLQLAASSAWNRRFALSLVVLCIGLSTFLLLAIERIRHDVRQNFAQSVSGTDLIVGARTGSVQLLLYSVFRIGNATNNVRWSSIEAISRHRAVAWVIPISLGDSHRGFPVIATSQAYFQHFRYGNRQALAMAQGARFDGVFEAVLGSEAARRLGYRLGQRIVLSHGDGVLEANDHADKPFTVVGILAPTGTSVDRSVHISLAAMEALHLDWMAGVPIPGMAVPAEQVGEHDLTPKSVTAALIGLKSRTAVFAVQRSIADFEDEPLMAILPGVALDELWDVVGAGERGLMAMSALVGVVSLLGLVAVIMAGLNERRRELSILRAIGAGPRQILLLLAAEGALVTVAGIVIGASACAFAILLLGDWSQTQFGIALRLQPYGQQEWMLIGILLGGGWLASLLPGYRAYRLSLVDGLSPRI
ncbi:ABC transporter permease [Chitinimonas koreensis]|uniref:ABC transporter permease n=1 Tax=Chitinimonas koreensis TaxID=356302 RepID=UPI00040F59AD|nr:ABC transporter permease [Chitinimonas koreensis]